jgi:2-methylcitrate dehydratase PrpD
MSDTTLTDLAAFAAGLSFEDLPESVVHETGRTLLDSIGCALAALSVDKGKMAVSLSRRLGGEPEATIPGTGVRVSTTNAAMAVGELINALDYDALYQPGGHVSPNVIPAPLAMAEAQGASGSELIAATALAHEVAIRVTKGMSPLLQMKHDEDGNPFYRWTPAYGGSRYNLGAAAGAAHLLDLDAERMAHAIALSGHHAQVPTHAKFSHSVPTAYTKYGTAGWQSTGAIVSALLAWEGYIGDETLFDGDHGLWRFTGSESWNPDRVIDGMGDRWLMLEQQYKPYPCCRLVHTSLDLFYEIIDEHGLQPGDIDAVRTFGHPYGEQPHLQNRTIRTPIDAQFSVAYIFAVAAHRVRVGVEWQDLETMRDHSILSFMDKVEYQVHPRYHQGPLEDPRMSFGRIEVDANGGTYEAEHQWARGTNEPGQEFDDDALVDKFRHNAARVLPEAKAERVIEMLLSKKQEYDVRELAEQLTV